MPLERAAEHHGRERLVELQRQQRRERRRLPLADLVAELRRRAALDVEADRQARVLRRGPQPVPRRVADVDVEHADDRAAVAERRAALELGGRGLGRVAGQEREHAQPIGRDRVELLDRPVVPRARSTRSCSAGSSIGKPSESGP